MIIVGLLAPIACACINKTSPGLVAEQLHAILSTELPIDKGSVTKRSVHQAKDCINMLSLCFFFSALAQHVLFICG